MWLPAFSFSGWGIFAGENEDKMYFIQFLHDSSLIKAIVGLYPMVDPCRQSINQLTPLALSRHHIRMSQRFGIKDCRRGRTLTTGTESLFIALLFPIEP